METIWLVNGRRERLDPADRGLAYGDGVFETMAAHDARIPWLDYHLERLVAGCERLAIAPPELTALRREIAAHCPVAGRFVVKLIITRGAGARGYRRPAHCESTRILGISSWSGYPARHYTEGLRLRTCALRLGRNPRLAGLKHLNRLEQVLAQLELEGTDAEEGLLLDSSGLVIGGISSNIFVVRGESLITPSLTHCGVAGVMRRAILEQAPAAGLTLEVRTVEAAELQTADEIFVSNALAGIRSVAALDGRPMTVGAVVRDLRARLAQNDA